MGASGKLKWGLAIALGVASLVFVFGLLRPLIYRAWQPIAHQRPYPWDQYAIPTLKFDMVPWSQVVTTINEAVAKTSRGALTQAVRFDTSPTRIVKVNCPPVCEQQADELIASYRAHEEEMNRRGAMGFEGAPCTGTVYKHHSIGCALRMLAEECGLYYEERADAILLGRMPREMECRAYRVTEGLIERMKQQRSRGEYKVGAEPLVSALIYETGIHSWSIMVPAGPNSWTGEFRYDKVFKVIPELDIILVLATPEEHVEAVRRLKASGLWVNPESDKARHNSSVEPTCTTEGAGDSP